MNLLWLYFDNGIDENGNKKSFKGILPSENGYLFDNRFRINFDKNSKTIYIFDNKKYVKLYNEALSSISCIVGKNGSGKTTFFELIITNISWGMNSNQPDFLISLYYEIVDNQPKFFVQLYRKNAKTYGINIIYNNNIVDYEMKNNNSPYETNMIPENTKYIFHSLSPFDKIFYSIALPLKENSQRIPHFKKQMDYIGIQKMFSDDYNYEVKTLANFIFMFKNDYFKTSFIKALNFEFVRMNIEINEEIYDEIKNKNSDFFNEIDNILEKINSEAELKKYEILSKFVLLEKEEQKNFFKYFFDNYMIDNQNDKLLWIYILNNINFNKFTNNYFMKNIENFLKLLNFQNCIKEGEGINYDCISKNFLSLEYERRSFLNPDIQKWIEFINDINIFEFAKKDISEIEYKKLEEFLELVRYLKNKDFIKFEIFLRKDGEIINYFYLSSGEKTLISYFANIVNSIYKFKPLKNKTFIILIDEVELHLHPEWQRRFISYMNNFFRENNLNVKFQFIIATHSPFVLSDIVDEQIIYIKDKSDLKINTFGANIYDIFEKGFFLENSIGKYSEEMIKAISLILSFYQALYLADKQDNIFVLRKILNIWYVSKNGKVDETYQEKKDEQLLKVVNRYKNKCLDRLFGENKLDFKKFEKLFFENNQLTEDIVKYINIIGDPIVKNHLLATYETIKEYLNEN